MGTIAAIGLQPPSIHECIDRHKRYVVGAGGKFSFNKWHRAPIGCSSSSPPGAGAPVPADDDDLIIFPQQNQNQNPDQNQQKWRMSAKMAKLGLAAVLAYGVFDAVTYSTFFVLAFLGYEKSTGKNPAANINALIGIVILMWTGNNITRPFRVAGAAALAPAMDQGLNKIQKHFNLPSLAYAFALVVGAVAVSLSFLSWPSYPFKMGKVK